MQPHRYSFPTLFVVGLSLLAAGPAAAQKHDPNPYAPTPLTYAEGRKIARELGLAKPRWRSIGPAYFASPNGEEPAEPAAREQEGEECDAATDPILPDEIALRAVNVKYQQQYEARIPRRDLELLGQLVHRMGLDQGSIPPEDARDHDPGREPREDSDGNPGATSGQGLSARGWSNNDDSRIRRHNTTSYPYRTIGTLYDGGGDCTATLIGPRHALTAAHCIYSRASQTWFNYNFKPGRNGSGSQPYGSAGPLWYWVPQAYIDEPGSGGAVNGWDFAVIVLDRYIGNGYMGYAALAGNVLNNKTLWMRGYPRCDTEGEPGTGDADDDCAPKTLWGDVKRCQLGTYFNPDGSGWNREIKTNCDGSAGQSGSSFYYYYWNSSQSAWIAATIGVFSQHYCLAGCPGSQHNAWPNVITRITPGYLNAINFFRFWYP